MKKCDICGRKTNKIYKLKGYKLCSKHMHQYYKYGKFLDKNPRNQNDLNHYEIKNDIVIFDIYDGINSYKISEFIIDKDDLEKVKYHKWRLSHSHIVTGNKSKGSQRELSWVIMNLDNRDNNNEGLIVDHIDCNPLNNRKSNLRICTQKDNIINNNTSGFIGVSYKKERNMYDPEIRVGYKRCHLGQTKNFKYAVFKRYYAEKILFKEYADEEEQKRKYEFTKDLSKEEKEELKNIVKNKLVLKNLWQ